MPNLKYRGWIEFDVLHDPRAVAMVEGLLLTPAVGERFDDCEWIQCARRYAERDSLTLYRNRNTGRFVLADVIYGDDVVQELESWDDHPGHLGISMQWIKLRCVPQEEMIKRIYKNLRESSYARRAAEAETEEERKDTARWLKRSGREELAALTRMQPFAGRATAGDQVEAISDRLCSMAKTVR